MDHLEAMNRAKEVAADGSQSLDKRLAEITTLLTPFGWRCELASGQVANFIRDKKFSGDAFITCLLVGAVAAFFWLPFASLPLWYIAFYLLSKSPRQNYVMAPVESAAAAQAA